MTTQKTRNVQMDILRGIAVALMILGHSFIVYPTDISYVRWCAAVQHFIYTFHMDLFFLISGNCYHCVSYLLYIKKKAQRNFSSLYVFWSSCVAFKSVWW